MTATIEGRPFRSFVDRVRLEVTAEGTKLTDTIDMELRPALKLIWPLIGPFMRRQRTQQVRALKKKLESEATPVRAQ